MGDVIILPPLQIRPITVWHDDPAQVFVLPFAPRELQSREQRADELKDFVELFAGYSAFDTHPNCRCTLIPTEGETHDLDDIIDALNAITE